MHFLKFKIFQTYFCFILKIDIFVYIYKEKFYFLKVLT